MSTRLDDLSAAEVVKQLDLRPHPEGGHYRETFRDALTIDGRSASTAIYFLLAAGERSHWHRVDATETWHWHAGGSLELSISETAGNVVTKHVLGTSLDADERPQIIVPAHAWQAARPLGQWTLVSCTVAPGFEFSGFELAPPEFDPSCS